MREMKANRTEVRRALTLHFRKNGSTLVRAAAINGLPAFITRQADGKPQTTTIRIEGGKIAAICVMRTSDKLRHLP